MKLKDIAANRKDMFFIDPRLLKEMPGFNVRLDYDLDELSASILENGVKVPLQVFVEGETLYVKDGHRRLRAVMALIEAGADIKAVPCITTKGETQEERIFDLITTNSGKALSKLEHGIAFIRLVNFGYTQNDIAQKIAKSAAYVSQAIILARAPKKVQDLIISGAVPDTTVYNAVSGAKTDEDRDKAYDILVESIEKAKVEGKGSRGVSRHVASAVGKVSPAARVKLLNEMIEEQSLLLKDSPKYAAAKEVFAFLKGEKTMDELIAALK